MEDFTELIQRLLEIQSRGRPRNLKVVADDERLRDRSRKRELSGKVPQTAKLGQHSSEGTQAKA